MINPIPEVYDYILGCYNALPQPLQALFLLSAGLFGISAIIHIVFK